MNDATTEKPIWLRILQYPPIRLILLGAPIFYCLGSSNFFKEQNKDSVFSATIVVAAMISLAILIYVGFVRFIERREATELSLTGMGREFGIGLLIGSGLYTACILILMVLGMYRIEGFNPVVFMASAIPMALSSSFMEELFFRGVLFRIVEEWLGSWVSIIVSSFVFGFVHLMNPDATFTGALFISVEAGLLLAAAYMLTRRLWMSIGFHMSWNYTQEGIFSGIVSGGESDPGLIKPVIEGPALLTGGQFGLEASLPAFVLCTAMGIILLRKAIAKGNVVKPFWLQGK